MSSFNEDTQASFSDSYGSISCHYFDTKQLLCLIFGCICVAIGIVDMIVLYVVPTNIAKKNKKNFPDATFSKPNKVIIAFHFVLHSLLIIFGVILIVYAFQDIFIVMCVAGIVVAVFWIVDLAFCYKKTFSIKSEISSEEMEKIVNIEHPIDYIFVYSKDKEEVCKEDKCEDKICYSREGVTIPILATTTTNVNFNFSDIPDILFFTLDYDLVKVGEMKTIYDKIIQRLKNCDEGFRSTHKVFEYHPERNGTYIISKKKVPSSLKQPARIASIIFGAGAYYEIYSKSFPSVKFTVKVEADVKQGINYENLYDRKICNDFGYCRHFYRKPKPKN